MKKKKNEKIKNVSGISMLCIYTGFVLCLFMTSTVLMSLNLSLSNEVLSRENAWLVASRQEDDDISICSSKDPCHCHKSKNECICMFGTKLGEDCIETGCDWHGAEDVDSYQYAHLRKNHLVSSNHHLGHGHDVYCDSCSAIHCHGCATKDTCLAEDPTLGQTCRWVEGSNIDIDHCESICSSSHCHACLKEEDCMSKTMVLLCSSYS